MKHKIRDDWESDPTVVGLTEEIVTLQQAAATRSVQSVIEIGKRLGRIRSLLARGQWERWVVTAVPLTRRTIGNYIALAAWARKRPRDIDRLAHLGPSKLYLLAPLRPARRRTLTSRKPIAVPGGGKKTIEHMTIVELSRVIEAGHEPDSIRRPPIGKVLDRIERGIASLDAELDLLASRKSEVEPRAAEGMRDRLVDLVAGLEGTFGLWPRRASTSAARKKGTSPPLRSGIVDVEQPPWT